jgi:3-oxoacyl-[acyl-carrier protein] reductase
MNTSVESPETDYLRLLRLDGRGFVVLGVGSGIGGRTCQALTQAGARVLCVDVKSEVAQSIAQTVRGISITADVTRRDDMQAVFDLARTEFGAQFSGVVDVVGVTLPGELPSYDDEAITRQFDLVLRHAILTLQIAAPMLAKNGGGSVVFVGSLAGLASSPRIALYGTAKAALHNLTVFAAHEFGPSGVRVNAVAPGRIRASGTIGAAPELWNRIEAAIPLRRAGEPEDIASVILFLASDLSRYVTGNVIAADGGITHVSALPSSAAVAAPPPPARRST